MSGVSPLSGQVGIAVEMSPEEEALLIVSGDTTAETFPVRRAGKKSVLRFAVGEPGERGTVWRFWANSGTDDVYLASRQTAHEVKISLHQSGDWRMQIVEPDKPKTIHVSSRPEDKGRILMQWNRPDPNPVGWIHALTIVLPGGHLNHIHDDNVRFDDVRWLPGPGAEEQTDLDVHIARPGGGFLGLHELLLEGVGISIVDALQLSSGDVVVVTALTGPLRRDELASIDATRGDPPRSEPPHDWDRSTHLGPRQLLYTLVDRTPRLYDLALKP